MEEFNDAGEIATLIENARDIAIFPSKVAGSGAYCASAGLFHMLKNKDKNVSLIYQGKVPDICVGLLNKEDIKPNVKERELLISIDYSNTSAEKVSYSTKNDILDLKIGPIQSDFNKDRVKIKVVGFEFDLVFIIGAQQPQDLGIVYTELEQKIIGSKIINIDNTAGNRSFGHVNVIDVSCDTLSLIILKNALHWGLSIDQRSGKSLLVGLTYREIQNLTDK